MCVAERLAPRILALTAPHTGGDAATDEDFRWLISEINVYLYSVSVVNYPPPQEVNTPLCLAPTSCYIFRVNAPDSICWLDCARGENPQHLYFERRYHDKSGSPSPMCAPLCYYFRFVLSCLWFARRPSRADGGCRHVRRRNSQPSNGHQSHIELSTIRSVRCGEGGLFQ